MRNPDRWLVETMVALAALASDCAPTRSAARPSSTPAGSPVAARAAPGPGPGSVEAWARGAHREEGLGDLHRAITTTSPEAQIYFDQGLRLAYGFNHDEATRSFAHAATLDPRCASCFWGVALTLGPNYNVPMLPDRAQTAWTALGRAQALAPAAAPVEKALIAALGQRYRGPAPLDPATTQSDNQAYAAAMRDVARRFPDDLDVQVLFAEALMDTAPWKLWSLDGKPAPVTEETVRTLESVLARAPAHPGANHYYVHAVEASPHPERALPSAERLPKLMPGAGHIVHMAAHIYQRVGRYADASRANTEAVAVDQAYLARTTPPGYYPMYLGHNYGFLAFSASMEGRGAVALEAARASARAMPADMVSMMPGMDFFISEPLLVMVRFARWDALLDEPRPPARYPVMTALWLHAHGMALAARGRLDEAARDLDELGKLGEAMPAELGAGQNSARDVVAVAAKILEARIAEGRKAPGALALWAAAVELADRLAYSEPADWLYPVRHFQGAALLAAHRDREAEAVFREDLRRNPGNGWALSGLARALDAEGRHREVRAVTVELEAAWRAADVKLTSSILE